MITKNFRYFLYCALSSLLLVGCDGSNTVANSPTQEPARKLNLTAITSRAAGDAVGDEVLTSGFFKVLAWKRDSTLLSESPAVVDSYIDELWVGLQESSGEYIPESVWFGGDEGGLKPWWTHTEYYWPPHYVACDFYAVYPTSAPNIQVEPRVGSKRPVRYIDYNNGDGRTDLLLAATTSNKTQAAADALAAGGTEGLVTLTFNHALSRVTLKAKLKADQTPQLSVTVNSVELCNVMQAGTFRFQDLPNTPGEAPLLGVWSVMGIPQSIELYNNATGVTLTETAQALTDATTATMFIPQRLTAWENTANTIANNNLLASPGTYLKIGCTIHIPEYAGSFTDNGYVYVPFTDNWAFSKNYEYTLQFGGGYDADGNIILQPVTITSTVTPWVNATTTDPDEGWI